MAEMPKGNPNGDMDMGVAVIAIIILFIGIWWIFHEEMSYAVLVLSDLKLIPVEMVLTANPGSKLEETRWLIDNLDPAKMSFTQTMAIANQVSRFYSIPVGLLMVYWMLKLYLLPKFNRKYDIKGLARRQIDIWPHVNVFTQHDIIHEDIDSGPWAAARSPVELIRDFKLIDAYGNLIEERVTKLLTKQLGIPYKDESCLDDYERALAGVFSAMILEKKGEAEAALDAMNLTYKGKLMKVKPAAGLKLFEQYYFEDDVQDVVESHFYKTTVLYALLDKGKEMSGVMSTSQFLWCKPRKRKLWYILNNVGRRVAWADVTGVYGHYRAEIKHGGKIEAPFFETCFQGLQEIVDSFVIN